MKPLLKPVECVRETAWKLVACRWTLKALPSFTQAVGIVVDGKSRFELEAKCEQSKTLISECEPSCVSLCCGGLCAF